MLGDSTGFFWTDTIYNYCVINKAVFEKKKHTVYFEMRLLIKSNPFLGMFLIDFISKAENLIGEFKLNEDGNHEYAAGICLLELLKKIQDRTKSILIITTSQSTVVPDMMDVWAVFV